jgi:4-hydroxy-tetrahydrodipicolinate reductase
MIRIIICGIAGRMGQEVLACARTAKDMNVVGGIEIPGHKSIGTTVQDIPVGDDLSSILPEADCVVEFTDRQATLDHLRGNVSTKKAYITGTTGFSDDDITEIERLAQAFPVFLAPNMSLGINHLYTMVGHTSKILAHYDVEVIETHHGKKKDAP